MNATASGAVALAACVVLVMAGIIAKASFWIAIRLEAAAPPEE